MRRAWWLCTVIALSGCYDFRKDLLECVRSGQCAVTTLDGGDGTTGADAGPGGSGDGGTVVAGFRQEICSTSNWCWQSPFAKNELSGVAALAENDVWVFGVLGTVMHFDGTAWARQPRATSIAFTQVVVAGAREFFVGSNVGVWHYDGSKLAVLPGSFVAAHIAVIGGEIWAIQGPNESRTLKHYVSGAWVDLSAPKDPSTTGAQPEVISVWGPAANDVWFAGGNGFLFHWDGSGFTVEPKVPTNGAPVLVLGGFGTQLFAADSNGGVYHSTRPGWEPVYNAAGYVRTIAGVAENDIWFGGQYGVTSHFNGSIVEATGSTGDCESNLLNAGVGVWAVDLCGNVLRRGAGSWTRLFENGVISAYTSVHGSGAADVWVGGEHGVLQHFDGTSWTQSSLGTETVGGLWVLSPTSAFATESVDNPNVPTHIYHWNGTDWRSAATSTQGSAAIWASPSGTAWAVGFKGSIVKVSPSGASFTSVPQASGVTQNLSAVAGSSDTDVWAGGSGGVLLHSTDGMTWASVVSPVTDRIVSLWAEPGSTTNAWGTTFDQTIHWDGTQWRIKPLIDTQNRFITGAGAELMTCDSEGGIQRGPASSVVTEESGTINWLRAAWEGPGGHPGVAVGTRGTILVRP